MSRTPDVSSPGVRCGLLWPDPSQRGRLHEIRDNLIARIAEADPTFITAAGSAVL
jgi:hypothetical protein